MELPLRLNVAAVNDWEDGDKLKWLKVRLTGRAQSQTAFQRLPESTRTDVKLATKALKESREIRAVHPEDPLPG